jgi:hypothetical protein
MITERTQLAVRYRSVPDAVVLFPCIFTVWLPADRVRDAIVPATDRSFAELNCAPAVDWTVPSRVIRTDPTVVDVKAVQSMSAIANASAVHATGTENVTVAPVMSVIVAVVRSVFALEAASWNVGNRFAVASAPGLAIAVS